MESARDKPRSPSIMTLQGKEPKAEYTNLRNPFPHSPLPAPVSAFPSAFLPMTTLRNTSGLEAGVTSPPSPTSETASLLSNDGGSTRYGSNDPDENSVRYRVSPGLREGPQLEEEEYLLASSSTERPSKTRPILDTFLLSPLTRVYYMLTGGWGDDVSLRLQNSGSVARDHLALERTFLAYMRTSLAIASAGVGGYQKSIVGLTTSSNILVV